MFNFSYYRKYKKKQKSNFNEISFLKKYLKYINLECKKDKISKKLKIKGITFKKNVIKDEFIKQYTDYSIYFINNEEAINKIIDNNNDGNFFEKAIILDILTEKIFNNKSNLNFKIFEVNSLYSLRLDKDFNFEKYKNSNIIFLQKSKVNEIFDFGFLIDGNNGKSLKLYQISLNKTKDDFKKLDQNIVELQCANIIEKLNQLGYIKKCSFGIITSLNVFQKKKEVYDLMKVECNNKKYEFLIYDICGRKIYKEENGEKNEYYCLFTINEDIKLNLPDFSKFFEYKPKFISTKYINSNYNKYINDYLNNNSNAKIIGKISFNRKFIDTTIEDDNFGLLISGETNSAEKDNLKNINDIKDDNNDITFDIEEKEKEEEKDIIIFKSKNLNEIYEKKRGKEDSEINKLIKLNSSLKKGHILLVRFDKNLSLKDNQLLNKKRRPEKLFVEKVVREKNNKKN